MKATLFFDIGNVLLFFSHEKMCKQIADLTKLPLQRVQDFLFKEGYGIDYELGNLSTEKIHEHVSNLTPHPVDFFELLKATGDIFEPNEKIIPIVEGVLHNPLKQTRLSSFDYPLMLPDHRSSY